MGITSRSARPSAALAALVVASVAAAPARADLEPIGPFTGDRSESFEGLPFGATGTLEVFLDPPTLIGGEPNGTIGTVAITSASSFMGSTVVPHGGVQFAHSTNPVELNFFTPVRDFGGYVATNGGASGGTVEFFDEADRSLGTRPLDVTFQPGTAPYTWNGWTSTVPIARIVISGNGVLQGFLGFDDLEIAFPPPAPLCPWDVDGDGTVGVGDLLEVVLAFGLCVGDCPADIDGDGFIGTLDLIAVIQNFGPCPGACPWDVNGDGVVDDEDLHGVIFNFGPCPGDDCPWDIDGDGFVGPIDLVLVAQHQGPCP